MATWGEGDAKAASRAAWGESDKPVSVSIGDNLRAIPRQVGLTARYALEGLPGIVDTLASPIKLATDKIYGLATGQPDFRSATASEMGGKVADVAGLPAPQTADERTVAAAARGMAGAAGGAGLARGVAGATGNAYAQMFAARPDLQVIGGGAAGGAGQSVKESGGSEGEQFAASLLAGLVVPVAADSAGRAVRSAVNRIPGVRPAGGVDQQIEISLRREGMNWGDVNERVRQAVREDVRQALAVTGGGELDPAALRRLIDFRATPGTTPTRATVTLDPAQITRERNLAKTGAAGNNPDLQSLAQIEASNNRALIQNLNDAGAGPRLDPYYAGTAVHRAGTSGMAAEQANVNRLYEAARAQAGRDYSLDGAQFTRQANAALDQALLQSKLPSDVRTLMNQVSSGQVPLTIAVAEQYKTRIGDLMRSTMDGQEKQALRLVRQALDNAPVVPYGTRSGQMGTTAPTGGIVPVGDVAQGEAALAAFNRARAANRAMMTRIESNPVLTALDEGMQPDQIVEKFMINKAASLRDTAAMRQVVANDPEAVGVVRAHVATWLKSQALNGAADEVGNFSQSAFNGALRQIGERKLAEFFTPEEIGALQRIGRVASYTQVQPRGSAVNNSNTGAMNAANAMDLLDRIISKLPVGRDYLRAQVNSSRQGQAVEIAPSLARPQPRPTLGDRLGPAGVGLLAAPTDVRSDEDRRNK